VLETPQHEIERVEGLIGSGRDPAGRGFAPLADALRRAGDLDRAHSVVEEGLQRHGDFMSGWIVAGWVHRDAGRGEEAGRAFERALSLDGENCVAILGLAGLAEERDDIEGALGLYRKALELDHSDPDLEAKVELLEMAPPPTSAQVEPEPEPELLSIDALAPAPQAEPEPEPEPELLSIDALAPAADPGLEDAAAGEMLTRSMGDVFAQQGLTAQAIQVYEQLVAQDPSDGSLTGRLTELRAAAAIPAPDEFIMDIGALAPDHDDGIPSIASLAPDA
jgi:tetratricopeptide (TPR) repeat protein